jgi:hypothetical protein
MWTRIEILVLLQFITTLILIAIKALWHLRLHMRGANHRGNNDSTELDLGDL